jgi:hypothetical protein
LPGVVVEMVFGEPQVYWMAVFALSIEGSPPPNE